MGSSQAAAAFFKSNITRTAIGLCFTATAVNSSLYTVDSGQRAVLFDRFRGNVLKNTVGEGTHFLIPWIQKPYIFDIRPRPHTFSSISAATRDLQMVSLSLRVLSRPDSQCLTTIFQNLGLEYEEKILPSIGDEVLKAVVAQFDADQLLTERCRVSALVRDALVRRAKDYDILLDDVAITHFSYDDADLYRIEASKKLLESKRTAEENKRKWILALRKAGEKRAREKLEQYKERIEAEKKLLKAKLIAEENERKRILALRKAEEEGEKRAREIFLKKQEQEKERIEAEKKLHEAKHIAEENERKQILALRKAEEEGLRRARESFLVKQEQEKEKKIAEENERKRILALRKIEEEEKEEERVIEKFLKKQEQDKPDYTATKVEHLRECLRSLKRKHQDENARVIKAFETLLVYLGNVVKNPMEEKYRKIRLSNPLFQERVGSLNGGVEFLQLCGFEEKGDCLYLPREKVDMELLRSAGSVINSAMTNPYFGLLST